MPADARLLEILDQTGLASTLEPQRDLRQRQAAAMAIDINGKVIPRAAPAPTPMSYSWGPSSTTRYRAARACLLTLVDAYATTAPTTGDAIVTITMTTEAGGTETIATATIPDESQFATPETPNIPVPAGAWIYASVTTANGASGVSISTTLEIQR